MKIFQAALLAFSMLAGAAFGQSPAIRPATLQARVEALFEPTRDLLDVKLAVDAIVDPATDTVGVRSTIGRMVAEIEVMAGRGATGAAKLSALKRYLHQAGPWNEGQPFQYDFDDPLGQNPANRLLQRYLTTRRGNCITMPFLFLVLGQRLGLTMTLAQAPLHVFVKYTDDTDNIWNVEATSGGGITRDA